MVVEGNHYFPRASLVEEHFEASDTTTICPWKGTARYLSVTVDGNINRDAAWYYDKPMKAAAQIKDRVTFWRGVEVR